MAQWLALGPEGRESLSLNNSVMYFGAKLLNAFASSEPNISVVFSRWPNLHRNLSQQMKVVGIVSKETGAASVGK